MLRTNFGRESPPPPAGLEVFTSEGVVVNFPFYVSREMVDEICLGAQRQSMPIIWTNTNYLFL